MKTKPTTLREILTNIDYGDYKPTTQIDQAEQAIKDLLLSKLPDKDMTGVGLVTDPHDLSKGPMGNVPIQNERNQAIEEVKKVIEEL